MVAKVFALFIIRLQNSSVYSQLMRVTERQTDWQTDGKLISIA